MRCRYLRLAAAAALFLPAGPRKAGAVEPGGLLACVQERYRGLSDLEARFVQESRVATLGAPRRREGTVRLQAPGRMRWEYAPPDAQTIVTDGETLWFHRPGRNQVIVQRLDAAFTRQTPMLLLFGRGDLAAEFTWAGVVPPAGADGSLAVELRPRVETPDLVRLVLEVVPGSCRLAGTVLEDAFGNLTRLRFDAERADQGLDPGVFRFAVPPGTEVVRP